MVPFIVPTKMSGHLTMLQHGLTFLIQYAGFNSRLERALLYATSTPGSIPGSSVLCWTEMFPFIVPTKMSYTQPIGLCLSMKIRFGGNSGHRVKDGHFRSPGV